MRIKNKRRVIAIIVILALIDIARETGVVPINFYNSKIFSSTSSRWNTMTYHTDIQEKSKLWSTFNSELKDPCKLYSSVKNISILTSIAGNYSSTGAKKSCHSVNIIASSFKPGITWSPFYKSCSFSAELSCTGIIEIIVKTPNTLSKKFINLHGTFTIIGNARIAGLCTASEAKRLLVEEIRNRSVLEVEKELAKI